MLKILVRYVLISFFVITAHADYERPLNWSGNIYKIIYEFNKVHKDFFKKVCRPEDRLKYRKLIRKYRGQGYYLPKIGDRIDREAIISNLHHFEKKISFIKNIKYKLKKQKDFPRFELLSEELNKTVQSLLSLKKQYHLSINKEFSARILKSSRLELAKLKKQFKVLLDKIYFFQSYGFPNNYLSYREEYEKHKFSSGRNHKKQSNKIYFFRKIVEDGALEPNKTRPDKFVRTALDTLYLNIMKEKNFLSEKVRYDLEWIERNIAKYLEKGKSYQLKRIVEWEKRVKNRLSFYQDLIAIKNAKKAKLLVQKENEATRKLKEYVYSKQAEVYNFWAMQSDLHKAMFALETILVHEVGVIDGSFGLERQTVAKVVLNRYFDRVYNQLVKNQPIVKYISPKIKTSDEKWLNVLFRTGEFSFTYHYIPAVAGIHCPDMSKRGKNIRNKNLKIALRTLKSHDGSFKAYRYFSRISMLGKIDMSSVWTNYKRLPEMPGLKSAFQKKLTRYYYAGKYQYLYSFFDKKNIEYNVIKIKDKAYSMKWSKGRPEFYGYRNPHLFTYFSKK